MMLWITIAIALMCVLSLLNFCVICLVNSRSLDSYDMCAFISRAHSDITLSLFIPYVIFANPIGFNTYIISVYP